MIWSHHRHSCAEETRRRRLSGRHFRDWPAPGSGPPALVDGGIFCQDEVPADRDVALQLLTLVKSATAAAANDQPPSSRPAGSDHRIPPWWGPGRSTHQLPPSLLAASSTGSRR
jgi:hypothetical protein